MKINWSNNDLQWLKENSKNFTVKELSLTLNRTEKAILHKCKNLNLLYKQSDNLWNKSDLEWLNCNSKEHTIKELADKFECSVNAIKQICHKHKFKYLFDTTFYWSDEEITFLCVHSQLYTLEEIEKHFNNKYSIGAIKSKIYSLGLKYKFDKPGWSDLEKEEFVRIDHLYTAKELAEMFNCTSELIYMKCTEYNVKCKKDKTYYFDEYFLEQIDSNEKAYLCGLFISDGHLSIKNKSMQWTLKDLELIQIIKQIYPTTKPIKEIYNSKYNRVYYFISYQSKILCDILVNMGFDNNKSLTCKIPNIDEQYWWHMIRGILDGDAWISKDNNLKLEFVGTEIELNQIKEFATPLNKSLIRKVKNYAVYGLRGKAAYEFLSKVYENSSGMRLTRKYQRYVDYCNLKNLPIST